jgi:hypothetical protein
LSRSLGRFALVLPVACLAACSDDDDDDGGGSTSAAEEAFSAILDEAQEVPAPIPGMRLQVTVTNRAPNRGTHQMPVWIAFHDGAFDMFNVGAVPASDALEPLAEDGETEEVLEEFEDSGAGKAQDALVGELGPSVGPLAPGESVKETFVLDSTDPNNRFFSYASMVVPSNDAFVANDDPMELEVFSTAGVFVINDFIVSGSEVLDAGTERNDEIPANTLGFGQNNNGTGVDQNDPVALHPGFLPPGSDGILDDADFAEADFTAPGYETLMFDFEVLAPLAATGVATVELRNNGSRVDFKVSATGLSGRATEAHFHNGAPGVAGPVIMDLTDHIDVNEDGNLLIEGSESTDDEFLDALRAGNIYVNVHTDLNPDGELRGQVGIEDAFLAELDADQEVPSPVAGRSLRVSVRNLAPRQGTLLTPVWIGLHDGTFQTVDLGTEASFFFPATNAIERLAEDALTDPLVLAFGSMVSGSRQAVIEGQFPMGVLWPGSVVAHTFRVNQTGSTYRFLSYATMVAPSNDAFIANTSGMDHQMYDGGGSFVGESFTVQGSEALDAGTEENDELPANTLFFGQTTPDTGEDEGGVVMLHPGFLPPGSGGILDDPTFADADFKQPGYDLMRIELKSSTPSFEPTGVAAVTLNGPMTEATFAVSARNLSGPAIAMHFHEGARGVAGPIVVDLTSSIDTNEDGVLFAEGTAPVDPAFVAALLDGNIYVNVHTALNPSGEVRGQVIPPEDDDGRLP